MSWLRLQQALLRSRTIAGRVQWLIRLRWLAALGVLSVGLAARYLTPVRFDIRGVYIVAAAIALYNGALYMLARQRVWDRAPEQAIPASRHVIHLQVVADLVCLMILVQWTGGLINPFAVFMVFHMAIAGIMLPRARCASSGGYRHHSAGDRGSPGCLCARFAGAADRLPPGGGGGRVSAGSAAAVCGGELAGAGDHVLPDGLLHQRDQPAAR